MSYIVGFLVHFGFAYFLGVFQQSLKISVKLKSPECEVLSGDFGYTLQAVGKGIGIFRESSKVKI